MIDCRMDPIGASVNVIGVTASRCTFALGLLAGARSLSLKRRGPGHLVFVLGGSCVRHSCMYTTNLVD
jgi:hypothetical protein